MSKSIKLKNDKYWDTSSIVHKRKSLDTVLEKTKCFYMREYEGVLVKLTDANLYKMIIIKIIGNGYDSSSPIDTIIQGYHYNSVGNFHHCKQHNNSGSLPKCTFLIKDNIICLYIPTVGYYSSLIISVYQTIPTAEQLDFTLTPMAKPDATYKMDCEIV